MLETDFGGLHLRTPIVVASGPASHLPAQAARAEECGAGAVVLKTVVSETFGYMRRWPRPRYKLLDWDGRVAGQSRQFTLYSYEQGFEGDVSDYADLIRRCKAACGIPIIGSVLAGPPDEWADLASAVQAADADALELDISCPHRPGSIEFDRDFATVIRASVDAVSFPVFAKLAPGPDVVEQARAAEQLGCMGVCLCNRLSGMDVDIQTGRPILHGGFGGVGGHWAKHYVLKHVAETAQTVRIPVSASGGVTSPQDAIKYILCGATAVQVLSAIILNGFEVVTQLVEGIAGYLADRKFTRLSEIRGLALQQLAREADVVRWPWRKGKGGPSGAPIASVTESSCTGCGRCVAVCHFDALSMQRGLAVVDPLNCSGCGLCLEVCPAGAIAWTTASGS